MKAKRRWWTVRKTRKGFRVRARASNGKVTFASTETYRNWIDAVANACAHGAPAKLYSGQIGKELRWPPK